MTLQCGDGQPSQNLWCKGSNLTLQSPIRQAHLYVSQSARSNHFSTRFQVAGRFSFTQRSCKEGGRHWSSIEDPNLCQVSLPQGGRFKSMDQDYFWLARRTAVFVFLAVFASALFNTSPSYDPLYELVTTSKIFRVARLLQKEYLYSASDPHTKFSTSPVRSDIRKRVQTVFGEVRASFLTCQVPRGSRLYTFGASISGEIFPPTCRSTACSLALILSA